MTRANRGRTHGAVLPPQHREGRQDGPGLPGQLGAADKHSDVKPQGRGERGRKATSLGRLHCDVAAPPKLFLNQTKRKSRSREQSSNQSSPSVSMRRESGRAPAPTPRERRCGRRSRCAERSVAARPAAPGSGRTASSRTGGGSSRRRAA